MPTKSIQVIFFLLIALGSSTFMASYYWHLATSWKNTAQKNMQTLEVANASIIKQQTQQRQMAFLDKKYTKDLYDAQTTIENLRDAVAAGSQRLRLNVHCPESDRKTSSPPSVADVTSPRLTDTAERYYWDLRQRITTADRQIAGLQDYIRTICLK